MCNQKAPQKFLPDYNEVTITHSGNRKCHNCEQEIRSIYPYLHMRRKRHIYNVCGKCIVLITRIFNANETHQPVVDSSSPCRCEHCREEIPRREPFLFFERNRHKFILCRKCFEEFAAKALEYNTDVKDDVVADLL